MRSNGECDLHPQVHPIVDKDLRLDDFLSFEYGILDLACIGHGFLGNLSHFAFLLQLVSSIIFFVSRLFTMSMSMRSSLLDDILRDWKDHRIIDEFLIGPLSLCKKCPHVQ